MPTLTAADYQAQHGKKPAKKPPVARLPAAPAVDTPKPVALSQEPEKPAFHYLSTNGRRMVCHDWPPWARQAFEELAARVGSRRANLHLGAPDLES